jgi:hypothetical protein
VIDVYSFMPAVTSEMLHIGSNSSRSMLHSCQTSTYSTSASRHVRVLLKHSPLLSLFLSHVM